jgi:NADPH:quinone reductase-like Zn-dependent oxidoreductase
MRSGHYIETPILPSGLGLEASGIVDAVGDGVESLAVGDAVSLIPPVSMAMWPSYGDRQIFPASMVVRHPHVLDWNEAAALWMAYLTAWGALVEIAGVRAGEPVVITAASSSVGLAAIQIANRLGAIPVAVTRTAAKAQSLLAAGASSVVASDGENFEGRLQAACGAAGARVVFDPVAGPLLPLLTGVMATNGILIAYGALSLEPTPLPVGVVLGKRLTVRGYLVHEVVADPYRLARALAFIREGVDAGKLRPVIAAVFPFEDIVQAHRYLESNDQFGKVVVRL